MRRAEAPAALERLGDARLRRRPRTPARPARARARRRAVGRPCRGPSWHRDRSTRARPARPRTSSGSKSPSASRARSSATASTAGSIPRSRPIRNATPGCRARARVSAAGPSFLRWPAASSTSGIETTSVFPRATSSSMPASTSGSASSMNPNPTGRSAAASRTCSASAQNSSSPSASRLPWPTTSSAALIGDRHRHAIHAATRRRPAPQHAGHVAAPPSGRGRARERGRAPASSRRSRGRASRRGRARRARTCARRARRRIRPVPRACHSQRGSSPRWVRASRIRRSSSSDDLQVAQREPRDRDQRARHPQPLGAAQDVRPPASSMPVRPWPAPPSVALARMPNASHSAVLRRRTAGRRRTGRTAPRSPAGRPAVTAACGRRRRPRRAAPRRADMARPFDRSGRAPRRR